MIRAGNLRCLATVWLVTSAVAQQLALDVNQGQFTGLVAYGSAQFASSDGTRALFDGWSQDSGTELWITDGTAAGTHLLRDLVPGQEPSGPEPIQWVGNRLLLSTRGYSLTRGYLWVTDGTPAGTVPMSDLPTTAGSFRGLGVLQGRAVFGGMQLWTSDLTEAGTAQIANCQVVGSYVQSATIGNRIVFSGNGDAAMNEPWVTDGTPAGTLRLADIHPTSGSRPDFFTTFGNHVYFIAGGAATAELWRTDGTPAGTQQVLTTPFARTSLTTERLVRAGNGLLAVLGGNLWRSDGTAAGTSQLLPAGSNTAREVLSDGTTAFAVYGSQLWRSDGTAAGTQFVVDLGAALAAPRGINFRSFVHQGQLRLASFNYASDITTVIASDGTAAGTTIADVVGVTVGVPLRIGTRMLLLGRGILGNRDPRLAISDGTPAGTQTLWMPTANSGNVPGKAVTVDGSLYTFLDDGVNGVELWRTDGTPGGTRMVADIYPGHDSGITGYSELVAFDGRVYFTALSPATGMALWSSDGTAAGTTLVYDSYGTLGAPGQLQVDGHELYFTDFDPTNQFITVLRTDGTPQGTTAVPGVQNTFQPGFGVLDGVVVHARLNQGLWRTDGTPGGTFALTGPVPSGCTRLGEQLVYFGAAATGGNALWVTDGTLAGTQQLLAAVAGTATTGSLRPWRNGLARLSANELVVTDGTPAGTTATQLPLPSNPRSYAFAGNFLYVVAEDAAHGSELWQSDGTAAGTVRVTDLAPGFQNGVASVFATPLGERVLLSASDGLDGLEPYVSDGTAAGTVRLADLSPLGSSNPQFLGIADDRVFYLADDGITGSEPGSLPIAAILNPALESFGVGCPGTAGLPELSASAPLLGTNLDYTLEHARPFAPCLFALAVGTSRSVLPSGCVLHVGSGAVALFTAAAGNGVAQQTLPLPLDPTLAGLRIGAQTLVLDPAGNALPGLAASQGLLAVLGL